jgi:hypothetical protein
MPGSKRLLRCARYSPHIVHNLNAHYDILQPATSRHPEPPEPMQYEYISQSTLVPVYTYSNIMSSQSVHKVHLHVPAE